VVDGCEVLAVGAHPDDVELGCGGLLARLVGGRRRVGILDLTGGELSTRGDAELRRREASEAATALGVAWRSCLGLPDGGLAPADTAQLAAVVTALRQAAPRVLLLPHPEDPHPDHAAASELLRAAAFLAGVARWGEDHLPPARPHLLLAYPGPRQILTNGVAIDVGARYAAKRAALAAHASQFDPDLGPVTHLASGHFLAAVEGRDRAVGNSIGCELAECFATFGAVGGDELAWLLSAGQ
jgi:N-acetylglucosamine malate deacetylase 1